MANSLNNNSKKNINKQLKKSLNKWKTYSSTSSGYSIFNAQALQGSLKKELVPKEKVCTNKKCHKDDGLYVGPNNESYPLSHKFCPICGEELIERLVDLKFDLIFPDKKSYTDYHGGWDYIEEVTLKGEEQQKPKEFKIRIGMKEFVQMIEAYKKEVFIDKI